MIDSILTVIILSCDKYSDLWDGHVKMIRKHWCERSVRTILVSESNCGKSYDDIEIFEAGNNTEFSERLGAALKNTKTDFVLIVLDDYYLTADVSNSELARLTDIMKRKRIDYLRLYSLPHQKNKIDGFSDLYMVDLNRSSYAVNLFPAIWKTEFALSTVGVPASAWEYEVSLTPTAISRGTLCAMTYAPYYRVNDIIRKGKVQHKSIGFLRRNGIELEGRNTCSLFDDLLFRTKVLIKEYLPVRVFKLLKKLLVKSGVKFYSS